MELHEGKTEHAPQRAVVNVAHRRLCIILGGAFGKYDFLRS
jgi:hypothetical protein